MFWLCKKLNKTENEKLRSFLIKSSLLTAHNALSNLIFSSSIKVVLKISKNVSNVFSSASTRTHANTFILKMTIFG